MSPKDFGQVQNTMSNQQYCLKWNNHQMNLLRAFDRLLQSESFTDVTLACEGRSLRAHKVVLSACSSYFETLFEEHPDKSPIVILKDVKFVHVSQLVNFMYRGEINITQDMLSGLLKTAETLKVKGLAEVSGDQSAASTAAAQAAALAVAQQFGPITPSGYQFGGPVPQLVSSVHNSTALTAALSSPVTSANHLAPFAALLNTELPSLESHPVNLFKRRREEAPAPPVSESRPKLLRKEEIKRESPPPLSPVRSNGPLDHPHSMFSSDPANPSNSQCIGDSPINSHNADLDNHGHLHFSQSQSQSKSQKGQLPSPGSPPPILTPIPPELSVDIVPDFLQGYTVYKLNDYLGFRTRQQFWEEPAVRRIMEAIKNKEIDMKSAAETVGVSYGTLYGRYREVYGYLKHAWVNKPGKSPGGCSTPKERTIWDEGRAQDLIQKVLSKELSLTAAAVRLGVDYNTFFAHVTDNGKLQDRVALLSGSGSPLKSNKKAKIKSKSPGSSIPGSDDVPSDPITASSEFGSDQDKKEDLEAVEEDPHIDPDGLDEDMEEGYYPEDYSPNGVNGEEDEGMVEGEDIEGEEGDLRGEEEAVLDPGSEGQMGLSEQGNAEPIQLTK